MSQTPSGLFTKSGAAQWASLSVRTIDRLIARGLVVFRPSPNGKILIRPTDLESFLRQPQQHQNLDELVEAVMRDLQTKTANRNE